MSREKEFEKVKEIIKENFEDAHHGIFNTRNILGDSMTGMFRVEYFDIDICYPYSYYEIFGTTEKEWIELEEYYESLRKGE